MEQEELITVKLGYLRSQDLLTPQTATGNCAGESKSGCMSQGVCLLVGLCRGHLLLHAGQHTGTRRGAEK